MRHKNTRLGKAVGFNMTPMIDVVFQLIIFFMLVSDLTNTQLERVHLAKASQAQEDKLPDKDRLVINLAHLPPGPCEQLKYDSRGDLIDPCPHREHWKIKINHSEIKEAELLQRLIIEGDLDRQPPTSSNHNDRGLSNRIVMFRGDAGAPYKIMEKILSTCAQAQLNKLEMGAKKPAE